MQSNDSKLAEKSDSNAMCSSFLFDGHDVRVQPKEDGSILFVAKDVAESLGISWSSQTLSAIPNEWKGGMELITPGGKQKLVMINEAGVYMLAFRSKKEGAKRFSGWVASEVLPSIRKTGSYAVGQHSPIPKNVAEDIKTCLQIAKPYHGLAKLFGCSKSTAAALTAQFVKRTTGRDMSHLLIENKATVQDPLVNPTDLASDLGYTKGNVGNKVNKTLESLGLQNHVRYLSGKGKYEKRWEVTEEGKKLTQIYDTGKQHSDGVPIQQVKWYKNKTLDYIRTHT